MSVILTEYRDELAPGIVDMWKNSKEGWNGENIELSEESVIEGENNTPGVQVMLAMKENDVAGYCKLTVDSSDRDTLYISLLNVQDKFHGQKIGKKLVLNAVEKTMEEGWPRLDLHTWPGNTKAVPLYKKCGFFWEKRDNSTHLINLIPTVLKTELFEDFFKKADWYRDSTREIVVEPDTHDKNGFDIWTYSWEKEGDYLEVDFSRRGRGITRVSTPDYEIRAEAPSPEVVMGESSELSYEIINKSGQELNIELTGRGESNISYDLKKTVSVEKSLSFSHTFLAGPEEREQHKWKTHPGIVTEMKVNGKKVVFKTGVAPVFPLTLSLKAPLSGASFHGPGECYLDLESHCNEKRTFSFSLPVLEGLEFPAPDINEVLDAKEKRSLKLSYRQESNALYAPKIPVKVDGGESSFEFYARVSELFHTGYGCFSGKDDSSYQGGIGPYSLHIESDIRNRLQFADWAGCNAFFQIYVPSLGKPFSSEFELKKCTSFDTVKGDGWILLKLTFDSDSFKGLRLIWNLKLFENGILERWCDVENLSDEVSDDIEVAEKEFFPLRPIILPFKGEFIESAFDNELDMSELDCKGIHENWLLSDLGRCKMGTAWETGYSVGFYEWKINFTNSLGGIAPGETKRTPSIFKTLDTFKDWHRLREFALGKSLERESLKPLQDLFLNEGNPFVSGSLKGEILHRSGGSIKGVAEHSGSSLEILQEEADKLSLKREISDPVTLSRLVVKRPERVYEQVKALFPLSDKGVKTDLRDNTFTVDNGILSFKHSKDFSPSLHALSYRGNEWLDSDYPQVSARSWWNPWMGGIIGYPQCVAFNSILKESYTSEPVEIKDSLGNSWSGMKITVNLKENQEYKGMVYSQYYLMLPGVPVLACFTEFSRKGVFTEQLTIMYDYFFSGDESPLSFSYESTTGKSMSFTGGAESVECPVGRNCVLSSENRKEKIFIYTPWADKQYLEFNNAVSLYWSEHKVSSEGDESVRTLPQYLIFTDEVVKNEYLQDLGKIRF